MRSNSSGYLGVFGFSELSSTIMLAAVAWSVFGRC